MHTFWTIPDVVHLVCQALATPFYCCAAHRGLVSLSLSCRDISPYATEALWSRLYSHFGIRPLLDALLRDLCDSHPGINGTLPAVTKIWQMHRSMTEEELELFERLSSRVRYLEWNLYQETVAFNTCFAQIASRACHRHRPFKRLEEITICGSLGRPETLELSTLTAMLGPAARRLTLVNVSLPPDPRRQAYLLTTAWPSRGNRIQHLSISRSGSVFWFPPLKTFPEAALPSWQHLRTLDLAIDSLGVVVNLSHLPSLHFLSLHMTHAHEQSSHHLRDITRGSGGFPYLKTFFFTTDEPLSTLTQVIPLFNKGIELESIYLSATPSASEPTDSLTRILDLIHQYVAPTSLKALAITEDNGQPSRGEWIIDEAEAQFADPYHLSILHPFHNLESLNLALEKPLTSALQPLVELGTHLPDIRYLRLGNWSPPHPSNLERTHAPSPKMTVTDLPAVLRSFPSLSDLSICIDAALMDTTNNPAPQEPGSHPQLKRLNVGNSPVADEAAITRFLRTAFPNLVELEYLEAIVSNERQAQRVLREDQLQMDRWRYIRNGVTGKEHGRRCLMNRGTEEGLNMCVCRRNEVRRGVQDDGETVAA